MESPKNICFSENSIRSSDYTLTCYRIIISIITNRSKYYAEEFENLMTGVGTREDRLINLIIMRSEIDLQSIREEFDRQHPNESFIDWISDDTSDKYQEALLALNANVNQMNVPDRAGTPNVVQDQPELRLPQPTDPATQQQQDSAWFDADLMRELARQLELEAQIQAVTTGVPIAPPSPILSIEEIIELLNPRSNSDNENAAEVDMMPVNDPKIAIELEGDEEAVDLEDGGGQEAEMADDTTSTERDMANLRPYLSFEHEYGAGQALCQSPQKFKESRVSISAKPTELLQNHAIVQLR
ncbi:unnamed protein product [Caenorhabditis angaria]|uniref:Uncharacterized protein n=1 Tax=Caenorhabditis angaria TaxID=860376 RepID=A0A9P1N3V3_9PELO|nr:unnamed protein product [Caenorhabditis angaria]